MSSHKRAKLNWLERNLPEGYVVDAAWLEKHGISRQLRFKYVSNGWLVTPARGVYRRSLQAEKVTAVTWQQLVISLNDLLGLPVWVGGRSALELLGFGHYLSDTTLREVHLYTVEKLPGWVSHLSLDTQIIAHNAQRMFQSAPVVVSDANSTDIRRASLTPLSGIGPVKRFFDTTSDRPIIISYPERAILELLDEVPDRETFHQADVLMDGLRNLSPNRLQTLLQDCRSVKVKRLFFWFAERHNHAWLQRLDQSKINLGSGKRMLVRGGKLNTKYLITVPENLDDGV